MASWSVVTERSGRSTRRPQKTLRTKAKVPEHEVDAEAAAEKKPPESEEYQQQEEDQKKKKPRIKKRQEDVDDVNVVNCPYCWQPVTKQGLELHQEMSEKCQKYQKKARREQKEQRKLELHKRP